MLILIPLLKTLTNLSAIENQAVILSSSHLGYLLKFSYQFNDDSDFLSSFSRFACVLSSHPSCVDHMLDVFCIPALYNLLKSNLNNPNVLPDILTTFGNLANLACGKDAIEEFDVIYLSKNASKKLGGNAYFENACDIDFVY